MFQVGRFDILESFPINFEIVYLTSTGALTAHDVFMRNFPLGDSINNYVGSVVPGIMVSPDPSLGDAALQVAAVDGYEMTLVASMDGSELGPSNIFDYRPSDPDNPSSMPEFVPDFVPKSYAFMDVVEERGKTGFVLAHTIKNSTSFYIFSDDLATTTESYTWVPAQWLQSVVLPTIKEPQKALPDVVTEKESKIAVARRVPTGVIALAVVGLLVLNESL